MQELPTIQPTAPDALSPEEIAALSEEVRALAAQRNAVILAHNYQLPEVQDVADHMGDSLGLSRQAAATDAEAIAFCGVHFMAETASILSPEKTVLIPDLDAGCSLADSIDADQLRAWKAEHPGALVVMYVNTSAEVKAETDYCCTSSNAVSVVEHIWAEHGAETEILFGPDMWLGAFVERETGLVDDPERRARFHVWDGECHVHAGIRPEDIARTRAENPEAEFLIHPECGCSTQAMEYVASGDIDPEGVHMLSTSGMLEHVEAHPDGELRRRHRERDALPAPAGGAAGEPDRGQPDGLLQVHEDDHAAEAARLAGGDEVRGQRPGGDRRAGAAPDRAHGRDRLAAGRSLAWPAGRRSHPVSTEASLRMARSKKRQPRDDAPRRPQGRRAPIIELNDVTKVYPGGHMALDRVSLAIGRGEFVFLVGPTGCGKSTLIKMLIRELAATEGAVKIAGRDIGALPEKKIPQLRRNIGTVFQDFKLLPDRTVYDNVAYALQVIGASRAEIREQVPQTLRLVGLSTKLHSYPDQLSGGEQQRVSVARAFVNHPPLLLADEPSGNLDPVTSIGVMQLLYRINKTGTTVARRHP